MIWNLPSLEKLKQIISLKLISNIKELSVLKIILLLYEHYFKNFDFPTYEMLIYECIPVAELFYTQFPSGDISFAYELLKEQNELFDILTVKLKINMHKFPSFYLKNLQKLREYYKSSFGGIGLSKFIL